MRLVSFIHKDTNILSWGIWQPEHNYILDIQAVAPSMPASLRIAIEQGESIIIELKKIYEADLLNNICSARVELNKTILQAPYTDPPRNIICTGINYAEHLSELARPLAVEQKMPEYPFIFTKPCTAIAHPETALNKHANITDCYDYEVELAVIIGKSGINISKEHAFEHVFGYTIINDLSARDIQRRTSQWYAGKALDGSAPFGPCIVQKNYINDPQNLQISCRINGETRQHSNTKNMIFDVATLIHTISQGTSLLAGDIIATGTPSGVGMSFEPPKYLQSGDIMELEIESIGILRNSIA